MKEQLKNQIEELTSRIDGIEAEKLELSKSVFSKYFSHLLGENESISASQDHIYFSRKEGDYESTIFYFFLKRNWTAEEISVNSIEMSLNSLYITKTEEYQRLVIFGKFAEVLLENNDAILKSLNRKYTSFDKKILSLKREIVSVERQLDEIIKGEREIAIAALTEEVMSEAGKDVDFIVLPITKKRVYNFVTNLKVLSETAKNVTLQITQKFPKVDESYNRIEGEYNEVSVKEFVGKGIFPIIYDIINN